jgi:hypothetical protein
VGFGSKFVSVGTVGGSMALGIVGMVVNRCNVVEKEDVGMGKNLEIVVEVGKWKGVYRLVVGNSIEVGLQV